MYYLILNQQNEELFELFPEGAPTFDANPDDFIEIYDPISGELIDVQAAFRLNLEGLTPDMELKLFQKYAAGTDDPKFVQSSFEFLSRGWLTIPVDEVESVVWRERERVFCFECDKSAPPVPAIAGGFTSREAIAGSD